jgi:GTP cyclohydrolase II
MRSIEAEGRGVVLYIPCSRVRARPQEAERLAAERGSSPRARWPHPLREFGLGAQVLADLGAQRAAADLTNIRRRSRACTGSG